MLLLTCGTKRRWDVSQDEGVKVWMREEYEAEIRYIKVIGDAHTGVYFFNHTPLQYAIPILRFFIKSTGNNPLPKNYKNTG